MYRSVCSAKKVQRKKGERVHCMFASIILDVWRPWDASMIWMVFY